MPARVRPSIRPTTTEAFQRLAGQKPAQAQQWLGKVLDSGEKLLPAKEAQQLRSLTTLSADQFAATARASEPLLRSLYDVKPVGVPQSVALPRLAGRLSVDRGQQVTRGQQGYREFPQLQMKLTTADGRSFELQSDNVDTNEIFRFVPGSDVMAFAGQDVQVRGLLDAAGKVIRVTEFAPGTDGDFVSGRVSVQGDRVFVNARGRGLVELTDPSMKDELRSKNNLGVIITGDITETKGADGQSTFTLAGKLDEYWMLIKLPEAPKQEGDVFRGYADAATNAVKPLIELPAGEVQKIEVGDRMYVKGKTVNGVFKASAATTSAGSPWQTGRVAPAPALRSVIEFTDVSE